MFSTFKKSNFHFLLAGVFVFSLHIAHASVYIPNVTSLYHFDDTTDASGNGHNLTNHGTALASGLLGNAMDTQTTGYLDVASSALRISGDYTVATWINPKETLGAGVYFIWRNIPSSLQEGLSYAIACVANSVEWNHHSACINTANQTLATSTWYWLVAERHGSVTDFYVNDALANTATDSNTADVNAVVNFNGEVGRTGVKHFLMDETFFASSAISTSTRDLLYASGTGAEECTSLGCDDSSPPVPYIATSSLGQFEADTTTAIGAGSSTTGRKIVFKATLDSASTTDALELQVEVEPSSTAFTNVPTSTSATVTSGNVASTTLVDLHYGDYHWQARVLDTTNSATSTWQWFGSNATGIDFSLVKEPPVYVPDVTSLYHFDDTTDATGNGHNLTNHGAAFVSGHIDSAMDTQGSGYLDVASSAMRIAGDYTIATWVRPKEALGSGVYFLWRNIPSGAQEGLSYSIGCTANHLEWLHGSNCINNFAQTLSTDTWYWLVAERRGSVTDFYVNNSLVNTTTDSHYSDVNAVVNFNGEVGRTGVKHFLMDETFFAASAISTSTRDLLYASGTGAEVCTTAGCDGLGLSSLQQYKSDATSTIGQGSSTTESYVTFGAQLNSNGTSTLRLDVEVRPSSTAFTGTPNYFSDYVASGSVATAVFGTSTLTYPWPPESSSNGNFHWQARAEVNGTGATSTWQTFGPTSATGTVDFKINTVPEYMQKSGPWPSDSNATDAGTGWWHNQTYDDGSFRCGSASASGTTIGYCGCAITTVVMWMRYSGITTDGQGHDVNPGRLNTWLTNNGGYDVAGNLKWDKITGYASSTSGSIIYDSSYDNVTSTALLRQYVDANVNSSTPNPVILREDSNDHFVLATGSSTNAGTSTFTIRDSAYYNTLYLNQADTSSTIYNYSNNIDKIHVYYDPPQIPAWGEYHVNLPNALMLVDGQGRRTGKDPQTGITFHEIPGTAYGEEYIGTNHGVGELFTSDLPTGEYTFYVLGGQTESYWMDASHYGQQDQNFQGNIEAGSMISYAQNYVVTDIANSTLSFSGTASSSVSISSAPPHNLPPPPMPAPAIRISPPPPPFYPVISPNPATSTPSNASSDFMSSPILLQVATSSVSSSMPSVSTSSNL